MKLLVLIGFTVELMNYHSRVHVKVKNRSVSGQIAVIPQTDSVFYNLDSLVNLKKSPHQSHGCLDCLLQLICAY